MKFYFIYSAGGGAGDWNGVKRVWRQWMPVQLKENILLKFGDVFLEHASGRNFVRPERWEALTDLRGWLSESVQDDFVRSAACDILLDSGTSKAVNSIAHHHPSLPSEELIRLLDRALEENCVFEKYIDVVCASDVGRAVTFDLPNPFKIRSQNGNARLSIFDAEANMRLIRLTAAYADRMHDMLSQRIGTERTGHTLSTVVNGLWSAEELTLFLERLHYTPESIAVGGLSALGSGAFESRIKVLSGHPLFSSARIHFLGCGGFDKVDILKAHGLDGEHISVDCSTFINRSIDGSIDGVKRSGYYDYVSRKLLRISPDTKQTILTRHAEADAPLYTTAEMEDILDTILLHQSGASSPATYDARAMLIFHNADVFHRHANA